MKLARLAPTSNPDIYRIVILQKISGLAVFENLGTFNRRKKLVTLNIFRLIFWLSKKNFSIAWSLNLILTQTLTRLIAPAVTRVRPRPLKPAAEPLPAQLTAAEQAKEAEEDLKFKIFMKNLREQQTTIRKDWRKMIPASHWEFFYGKK